MWGVWNQQKVWLIFDVGHVCYSTFSWKEEAGPLIWLTAKHLACVPPSHPPTEMNDCRANEVQGEKEGEKKKKRL